MKFLIQSILMLCFFSHSAYALDDVTKFKIKNAVDNYYDQKTFAPQKFSSTLGRRPPVCDEPSGPSCVDFACQKLGTFGCDTMDEVREVTTACRGNRGSACMEAVCTRLGTFGCDTMNEIREVARACVGNFDTECLDSTCRRLGTFGCDTQQEIFEVLRMCAGN